MQIWRGRDKKLKRLMIKDSDGTVADSSETGAWMLAHFWQPVFDESRVNLAVADKYLKEFVIKTAVDDEDWVVPFFEFQPRCGKKRDTGPGPDDVPYSAWRAAPGIFQEALYGVYWNLLGGRQPHSDFNCALLPFIEKGTQEGDRVDSVIRAPKQTTPLFTKCKMGFATN